MKIEMREDRHLWVQIDPAKGDFREVIIDRERDVRICDGQIIIKVRFQDKKIRDILVNDVFVWTRNASPTKR